MEAIETASDRRQPFREKRGQGVIVFDPMRLGQVTPALFDPASYGANAQPVQGQGGRGAAWFVRGGFGEGVLRHYRRGGWMARFSEDAYFWLGERRARSFSEFALLQRMYRAGLPVPAPIAATYLRRGWYYRAAIVVERIAGARSFAELVDADGAGAPWTAVGAAIAACHRFRAHHADLNAHNILVGHGRPAYLIDWDKGRIEPAIGAWCERALDRLERSLRKSCKASAANDITDGMKILRAAHRTELQA